MAEQAEESSAGGRGTGLGQAAGRTGTWGVPDAPPSNSIFDGTPLSVLLSAEYRRLASLLSDRKKSGLKVAINILPGQISGKDSLEGLLLLYANDPIHRCKYLAIDERTFADLAPLVGGMLNDVAWAKEHLRSTFYGLFAHGDVEPLVVAIFDSVDRNKLITRHKQENDPNVFDVLRVQAFPEEPPSYEAENLLVEHAQAVAEMALIAARQKLLKSGVAEGAPEFNRHFNSIKSGPDLRVAKTNWLKWYAANTVPIEVPVTVPGAVLGSINLYVYKSAEWKFNATNATDIDLERELQEFFVGQATYFGSSLRVLQALRAKHLLELAFAGGSTVRLAQIDHLVHAAAHCLIGCKPMNGDAADLMKISIGGRHREVPIHLKKSKGEDRVTLDDYRPVVEWQLDVITPSHVRRWPPLVIRLKNWLMRDPKNFYSTVGIPNTEPKEYWDIDDGGAYPLALLIASVLYLKLLHAQRENLTDEMTDGTQPDSVSLGGGPNNVLKRSFQLTTADINDYPSARTLFSQPLTSAFEFTITKEKENKKGPTDYNLLPSKYLPESLRSLVGVKQIKGRITILEGLFGPKKMPTQVLGSAIKRHHQSAMPDLCRMFQELGLEVNCKLPGRTIVTQVF